MATGITEQDVWKAADALLIEGQRPTIERVRQKIGRGSPNTVQPYLDTWFKGLGARIRDPQAFSLAATLPDRVTLAAQHLWDAASAEAREALQQQFQAERDGLAQDREALEQERQALARREATLLERVEALTAALSSLQGQFTEAQQRAAQAEEAKADAARQNAVLSSSLNALRDQLDQERSSFDVERRQAADRSEHQERHWLQEVDRVRQELKQTLQANERLREQEVQQRAQLLQVQTELASVSTKLATTLEESNLRDERSQVALASAQAEAAQLRRALLDGSALGARARAGGRGSRLRGKVFTR